MRTKERYNAVKDLIDELIRENPKVKKTYNALITQGYTDKSSREMLMMIFLYHLWEAEHNRPMSNEEFEKDLDELEQRGPDFLKELKEGENQ
jgi:hypothetical protein